MVKRFLHSRIIGLTAFRIFFFLLSFFIPFRGAGAGSEKLEKINLSSLLRELSPAQNLFFACYWLI